MRRKAVIVIYTTGNSFPSRLNLQNDLKTERFAVSHRQVNRRGGKEIILASSVMKMCKDIEVCCLVELRQLDILEWSCRN